MKNFILLCSLFLFFGCISKNSKSQAILWTQKTCCDHGQYLLVKELNISYQSHMEISFCEEVDSVIRLTLLILNNNQQKTLIDLLGKLPLENQQVLLKINKKPMDTRGVFNFNEKLNDGDYYLFIATDKSCGDIRFNLLNGKKTLERLTCIKYCENTSKNH